MKSFISRFKVKILANSINLVSSAALTIVLPKSMSVAVFGLYEYLMEISTQLLTFLQFNTSEYFIDDMAKKKRLKTLNTFLLLLFIAFIIALICGMLLWSNPKKPLEIGNTSIIIILSISTAFSVVIINFYRGVGDALKLTVITEKIIVLNKIGFLATVFILFYFNVSNLINIFSSQFFLNVFFAFIIFWYVNKFLKNSQVNSGYEVIYSKSEFGLVFQKVKPLLVYSFLTLLFEFADRTLIQYYGGSLEQGYFGIANRFATISFMVSSSVNPLLFREFSELTQNGDILKVRKIIEDYMIVLFAVASFFGVFVFFNSKDLILYFYGSEHIGGYKVLALMSLYPLQQTYGQLLGSLFYASGYLKKYRYIAVSSAILGIILSFILLMPESMGGLNFSSSGLAVKKLVTQFFGVFVSLLFFKSIYKISVIKIYKNKIYLILFLSSLLFSIQYILSNLVSNILLYFILQASIYFLMVIYILIKFSVFFGLDSAVNKIKQAYNGD